MNWTGGRLSRHSRNAAGSLTQRQKQHFAKARSNQLKGSTKRSPIKWTFFSEIEDESLQDMPKRSATPQLAPHRSHTQQEYTLDLPEDHGFSRKQCHLESNFRSPRPESQLRSNRHPPPKQSLYDEQYIKASPDAGKCQRKQSFLQAGEHKRRPPVAQAEDDMNSEGKTESLEHRRRRILRKGDWVGASIQRPLKLKFSATRDDARVGKRRRISAGDRNQFGAKKQSMITSPFAATRMQPMTRSPANAHNHHSGMHLDWAAEPRNNVRISIGGRQIRAGVGSGTSKSKALSEPATSSRASTSEVMLLDGSETGRLYRQTAQQRQEPCSDVSTPNAKIDRASTVLELPVKSNDVYEKCLFRRKKLSSRIGLDELVDRSGNPAFVGLRAGISTPGLSADDSVLSASRNLGEHMDHTYHTRGWKTAFPAQSSPSAAALHNLGMEGYKDITNHQNSETMPTALHQADPRPSPPLGGCITNVSKQLSESARKLQSVARDKSRRIIRHSSQPQLLHPIPQTSRTSQVLRSDSSEVADSTVVQIGIPLIVPPSLVLDEKIWKTWLPSEGDEMQDNFEEEQLHHVSISPGISIFTRRVSRLEPIQSEVNAEIIVPLQERYSSNDIENKGSATSQDETLGEGPLQEAEKVGDEGDDALPQREVFSINQVLDYRKAFLSLPKQFLSQPKPARQENPDEAWMKFILSDDKEDDDEELAIKLPCKPRALSRVEIKHSPESSMLAHPSTETNSSMDPCFTAPNRNGFIAARNDALWSSTSSASRYGSPSDPLASGSIDVQPHSIPTSALINTSSLKRKITFTKPRRFTGLNQSSSPDPLVAIEKEPLHIGSKPRFAGREEHESKNRGRRLQRDIYSLSSSDDAESIEDN